MKGSSSIFGSHGGVPYLATETSDGWVLNEMNASFILEGDTNFSHQLYYNDTNQIAGTSTGNENHAFIASKLNGQWTTSALGSLGGNISTVSGLNNSNQIVGTASLEGNESTHGFLATKTGDNWNMIDLGTLGGNNSKATDINDAGQIVGSSEVIGQNNSVAVLISNGQAYKLIDLVPEEQLEGWSELSSAFKINNKGQIIGTGKYNNQSWNYLLDPISIEQVSPPICEMGLDPKKIKEGEGTALWWWSDAVISAEINNGIGNVTVPSDYKWFYPTQTTTFKMHAKGADGTETTCETKLIVEPPRPEPPVCEMGVDPQRIMAGEGTALWWWSDNVESAVINRNSNGVDDIGPVTVPSDYKWIFPRSSYTYTMVIQGDDGTTSTCSTTIIVMMN